MGTSGNAELMLDYVGMSDLLSPIYVVFDCNEADAFWGLVGVMRIMVSCTILPFERLSSQRWGTATHDGLCR